MNPEKALEAKERGNEQFRAGQWAKAIEEYEEVRAKPWLNEIVAYTQRD